MRLAIVLMVSLFIVGCATPGEKHKATLQSWVGQPADNLIASWGMPTQERELDSGKRVIEYVTNGPVVANATSNPYLGTTVTSNQRSCRTTFMVSEIGLIESGSWYGYCD